MRSHSAKRARLIVDLCGGTGSWSRPYAEAGYAVVIVDPMMWGESPDDLQCERIRADVRSRSVRKVLRGRDVHGVLAAPPCTAFTKSGARWWKAKDASGETDEGLRVVRACLSLAKALRPAWWALENPVGRLRHYIGAPELIFHPCDYGDPWTKHTCLWGSFTHPVRNPVEPIFRQGSGGKRFSPIAWMGPHDRSRRRSMTPPHFAQAFFRSNP